MAYEQADGPPHATALDDAVPTAFLSVVRAGDGFDVVESVNPAWLAGKTWPIVLDPSWSYTGVPTVTDCAVSSVPAQVNNADCSSVYAQVGPAHMGSVTTGAIRLLQRFDTSAVPSPVQVTAANVLLTSSSGATGSGVPLELREAGAPWTTKATWLTTDGTTPWPTATTGGDPGTTLLASGALQPGGAKATLTGTSEFVALVDGWINGTTSNPGLVLKATTETGTLNVPVQTTEAADPTARPALVITYNSPPDAPGALTATRGDRSLSASWTTPANNGAAITSYTLDTYTAGGSFVSTQSLAGTATNATVSGLTNGTGYYVRLRAINGIGTGPAATSNTVTPAGLPFAPSSVAATRGDQTAGVSWTAPSGNGEPISSYTVRAYSGATLVSTKVTGTAATTTSMTGLTNGTAYTFTVAATNVIGEGPQSPPSAPVTPAGAPLAPTSVSATPGDQRATVTWAPANPNGDPITTYTVKTWLGSTLVATGATDASATSYTQTGLVNGTTYTLTVAATNGVGTGTAGTSNAVIPSWLAGPPTTVTGSYGNASVSLSWNAGTPNGSAITGYVMRAYAGTTLVSSTPTGSPALTGTVAGLTNGTAYTFTVAATNANGTGVESPASAAITPGVPFAPASVTATRGDQQLLVSWAAADGNAAAVTGYTVTTYQGSTVVDTRTVGAVTSATVPSLTNGAGYVVRVAAINVYGTGTSTASTATVPAGVPFAPTAVTGVSGDQQVSVTWTAPSGNGDVITSYTVTSDDGAGHTTSQTVSAPTFGVTVTGLTNGVAYTFTVTATNGVGTGPASAASAAVTPAGVPLAPATVSATAGDTTANVTWSPVGGNGRQLVGYRLVVTPCNGGENPCTGTSQAPISVDASVTQTTLVGLKDGTTYTVAVSGLNDLGSGAATSSNRFTPQLPQTPTNAGEFVPVTPARLVDSRTGLGGITGPVTSGTTSTFTALGQANVPSSGVSSLVLSVTVIDPTSNTRLCFFPTSSPSNPPQTGVTSVGLVPGLDATTQVIVKPGVSGQVSIYHTPPSSGSATVHVAVDVFGYFTDNTSTTAAGTFVPVTPARLADTMTGLGQVPAGSATPLQPGEERTFTLGGAGGLPSNQPIAAVALAVTALNANGSASLSVFPTGQAHPAVGSIVTPPTSTGELTTLVQVPVDDSNQVTVYNPSGTVDVRMDIEGYYLRPSASAANYFVPINPTRVYDTNTGLNTPGNSTAKLSAGSVNTLTVAGIQVNNATVVPSSGVTAVAVTATAFNAAAAGELKVYPAGGASPSGIALSYGAVVGNNYSNMVIAKLNGSGAIALSPSSQTHVRLDVVGYYAATVPQPPAAPTVTSTAFTAGLWTQTKTTGTFTFNSTPDLSHGSPDHYVYAFDDASLSQPSSITPASGQTSATTAAQAPGSGWHTLYVRAVDAANNLSPLASYAFGNGPGVSSPTNGAHTQDRVMLGAAAQGTTYSQVRWKYSAGNSAFVDIPVTNLTTAAGGSVSGWPQATTGTATQANSPTYLWNVAQQVGADMSVQVEACFINTLSQTVCADPVTITLDRSADGAPTATTDVGVGSLNLVTGHLTVDASDVSVPAPTTSLDVSRTYNTGHSIVAAAGAAEMLTDDQAEVEGGVGGFTTRKATATQYTARAYNGAAALQVAPAATGAGNDTFASIGGDYNGGMRLGIAKGASYTFTTRIYVPTGTPVMQGSTAGPNGAVYSPYAQSVQVVVRNAAGVYRTYNSSYPTANSQWQELTVRFSTLPSDTEAFIRLWNGAPTADMTGGTTAAVVFYDHSSLTREGAFGPGWVSSLDDASSGNTWTGLVDRGSTVTLHDNDNTVVVFQKSAGGKFVPTGDDTHSGLSLVPSAGSVPATWTLTDLDKVATVFEPSKTYATAATTTSPHSYYVDHVTQPGSSRTTSYTYNAAGQVTQMLAPQPVDADCANTWVDGCRALQLAYNGSGHLTQVQLKTNVSGSPVTKAVACYAYDDATETATGQLQAAWDPRITSGTAPTTCGSQVLATSYGYASGRLSSITPAGLAATTLGFDSTGRLTTITQTGSTANGAGGTRTDTLTSTVVYGVPVGADGANPSYRPDLATASTLATWGQSDVPATAVALFGPGDNVSSTDLRDAWVSYLNADGRISNTGAYSGAGAAGWHFGYTAYDSEGRAVRELSPANRELAVNPSSDTTGLGLSATDLAGNAAALSSVAQFSADGMDVSDTYGPWHLVTLPSGAVTGARAHSHTEYDTGSELGHPAGELRHLPVASYTAASLSKLAVPTNETDHRLTETAYALSETDTSGWTFSTPLRTTVDPRNPTIPGTGLAISTITRLDAATGMVVETRMPSNPSGGGAGTTKTIYYTAGANSDPDCDNSPAWVGLMCKTTPAAQAGVNGLPSLVTTWTKTYDYLLRPVEVVESVTSGAGATVTRTSTTSFDAGGFSPRLVSTSQASTDLTAAPLATTTTGYSATTGLATSVSTNATTANPARSSASSYDAFGRVQTYTDGSTGGGTVTTLYDAAGRVSSVTDARGTTSWTYNSATERRGLASSLTVDGGVGTWTATYDSEGRIGSQTWPNGLVQTWIRDPDGQETKLVATKAGSEWLNETVGSSIHGQWRSDFQKVDTTSGLKTVGRGYAYDNAGRLVQVDDTEATGTCTTRVYGLDADSNRLSRKSYPAGAGGSCTTSTTPSTVTHAYDTADRLLGNGVDFGLSYDAFGRITSLPAADTPAGGTTPVTASYYADDQVRSLSQGSNQVTFGRDAAGRIANRVNGLGVVQVENHYGDASSDSPDWITETQDGLSWTRNITDLTGNLAATITQAGTGSLTWQVTNLHGDIAATVVGSAAKPEVMYTSDEYGTSQTAAPGRYGWLGANQRAADTPGGLTLMGVRLYSPILGRFLQTDPVQGGSCNAYDYGCQDPINQFDFDGRMIAKDVGGSAACTCTAGNKKWATYDTNYGKAGAWQHAYFSNINLRKILSGAQSAGPIAINDIHRRYRTRTRQQARCHNGKMQFRTLTDQQEQLRLQLTAQIPMNVGRALSARFFKYGLISKVLTGYTWNQHSRWG